MFYISIDMIMFSFHFYSIDVVNYIDSFSNVKPTLPPRINPLFLMDYHFDILLIFTVYFKVFYILKKYI